MTVLVGHACAHGSTREIAERIAARLSAQGLPVEIHPMDQAQAAAGYDASVLGSAIHGGDWLPEAATFLGTNINALAGRPVWLFSVGTVGDHSSALGPRMSKRMRAMTKNPPSVARYRETLRPRDHRRYAGVLRRGDWPLTGRWSFHCDGRPLWGSPKLGRDRRVGTRHRAPTSAHGAAVPADSASGPVSTSGGAASRSAVTPTSCSRSGHRLAVRPTRSRGLVGLPPDAMHAPG